MPGPRRLNRVGAALHVFAGDGPAVTPEQRPDIEDADAAAIEVGFIVAGELLHAVTEIEQPEMPGADVAAAGSEEQLAAPLQHVDAHVVEKRTGHLLRAPHPDVVAGVRPLAAGSVRDQQVIPAVAEDHDRGFRIDRDVDRLAIGIQPLAGLRVQFDQTDVAEVGTVGEPERAVRRVAKHAGIDGVAVLDAVGPHHRSSRPPTCNQATPDRASCRPGDRSPTSAACRARNSRESTCRRGGSGRAPTCCCRRAR